MLLLALLACSTDPADDAAARRDGAQDDGVDLDPPDVVPLDAEAEEWATGVVVSGAEPFLSARLLVSAPASTTVEVRLPGGDWTPVTWASVEGEHRAAVFTLDEAAEELEVRADGPLAWAQAELFVGDPVYDDDDPGEDLGDRRRDRAVSGMWQPSSATLGIGMQWYLDYEYAESCAGTTLPGTLVLAEWLKENTEATSYGTYSCRSIVGGTGMSVHSEGRAIDLFVPLDGSDADNDKGDPIAAYLIEHAEDIGISLVIWDRASWGAHRSGDKHESYGGSHPHHDHLHIELTSDGAWGGTRWFGEMDAFEEIPEGFVDMAATPSGGGYWVVHTDGGVEAFGDAAHHGDAAGWPLAGRMVAIAPTPSGNGYWLAGEDGGVFAFGDAPYYGSMGGYTLEEPVIDIAARPGGDGYWLVATDGGVFSFGAAGYHGSMGGQTLNGDMVGMAASPSGAGYWLAAEDGGVFAYGDAGYQGSMGGTTLNAEVTAVTGSAAGYRLYAEDGGTFDFGTSFHGSLGDTRLNAPIMSAAATPSGAGYWMLGLDGGIFTFGDAPYAGNAL